MSSAEAAQARILATTPHEKVEIRLAWRHLLDGVTMILAIASIIFAYVQKLDSSQLKDSTKQLLGSVTTGYIAEFPESIPVITGIVQHTCGELSIMADLPGYGQYSDPDAFYSYKGAIIGLRHRTVQKNLDDGYCVGKAIGRGASLNEKAAIHLLLFSPKDREASVRLQLTKESLMKGLADPKDASTRTKLTNFLNANTELLHEKPEEFLKKVESGNGYEEFIGLLLTAQRDAENDFRKAGIEIRYARQPSIMRIWIQDSSEAAFSFDHSSETELAFQTRDSKLLENFHQIFEQHWSDGVSYEDYWNTKAKTSN